MTAVAARRPAEPRVRAWAFRLGSDRITIAALIILAAGLRAPNLGRSYWVDEGISIGIASHPLSQVPRLLRQDGSPPLFYVILHYWTHLFGTSEIATHCLPLLFSLAAVPLGYWAGKDMFDRRAGLAAAALLATNPFLGWYSTETRMYPIVVVLSILGVTLAWRAVRDHRGTAAAGAVVVFAALLYTHNWGIYLLAVTSLVLAGAAWARGERAVACKVAAATGAVIVLWLPWLPSFLYQAHHTAAPWAVRPAIGDFFADPASALGGTLGFLVAPLLVVGAWWCRELRSAEDRSLAWLVATIGLLTALLGFLAAQIEPSWTVRYLAVIIGPLLLASAGALGSSRRGQAVVAAVCVVLSAWAVIGVLIPNPSGRYAKSNVSAVAQAVSGQLRPGDMVIVTQTEQLAVASRYLPRGLGYATPTGQVSDPSVVDWRDIVHRLQGSSPCSALGPALNALPVGAAVLEINPVRRLGASGTAWSRAANYQVRAVDSFLAQDPALVATGLYTPALDPRPFSPVDGVLFRKVSVRAACS